MWRVLLFEKKPLLSLREAKILFKKGLDISLNTIWRTSEIWHQRQQNCIQTPTFKNTHAKKVELGAGKLQPWLEQYCESTFVLLNPFRRVWV